MARKQLQSGVISVLLAVTSLLVAAPSGNAATLQCGDTITQTTVLDADIVCTDPGAVGMVIGADNVTLWLNGHTIRGVAGSGGVRSVGIGTPGTIVNPSMTVHSVQIRGGTVDGFNFGVYMYATNTSAMRLTVNATTEGITLDGSEAQDAAAATICDPKFPANNCVYRSVVNVPQFESPGLGAIGIHLPGNDNRVWRSTVHGSATGILAAGASGPRVVLSRVGACYSDGINIGGENGLAYGNVIDCPGDNGGYGISADGPRVRVRNNTVTGTTFGIGVSGTGGGIVSGNNSSANGFDGFEFFDSGFFVKDNTANDNGSYGFEVDPFLTEIDGGGNHASGNGVAACTGDPTFCAGVTP